jgi:hypothetical protein
MFCEQCEQTASGNGCHQFGACGKSPEVNAIQDLMVYCLRGLAPVVIKARELGMLTSCSRTKERLAERVKKVEKGVEVKKQQNNGNHSYTSSDPSLYIARFDADLLSTR